MYFDARYFDKKIDLSPSIRDRQDLTTILSYVGRDFLYHTWYARHYDIDDHHTRRINKIWNMCRDFLDMRYVTFIVQYIFDHQDRRDNLVHMISNLRDIAPLANVIIYERGEEPTCDFEGVEYVYSYSGMSCQWHRTKDFNDIIKRVTTPYICLYDCDVFFDMKDHYDALSMLKEGVSMVYPYNGRFLHIDRKYLSDGVISSNGEWNFEMFGGAVYLNRKDYIEAGMENENLKTYGLDDFERYDRMKKLGYKIARTSGLCYHISHYRGKDSLPSEDADFNYKKNEAEWIKVRDMDKEQLEEYIKTWKWCNGN
jgi:hypothetical protein